MPDTSTPEPLWNAGWYRPAHPCPSPNFGARPANTPISLVVLHSISLPPGQFGGDHVQQLFLNQLDWNAHPAFRQIKGLQVSAHFYIRRDGELWQFVSCDARAWHAGESSHKGRRNCNDYSIGIELEGLAGEAFEPAQYQTLLALLPELTRHYPVSDVFGHEHIAPGRKTDPGPGFDWPCLQQSEALRTQNFPAIAYAKRAC